MTFYWVLENVVTFWVKEIVDAVRVVYADIQWVEAGCVTGGVEEVSAD
jgi:hypothetical protein